LQNVLAFSALDWRKFTKQTNLVSDIQDSRKPANGQPDAQL